MENEKTNWCQSVTGVVIRDGRVLLARHTYGAGKGRLIVPGGYVEQGESPEAALRREFMEETGIQVEPERVIAIRFNAHDWYAAFSAKYVGGQARSDHDENDEVIWMDVQEALNREDVPDLTKKLIACALKAEDGLFLTPYKSRSKVGPGTLYGIAADL